MKLIVGLGNPGIEYVGTRHNVGFETIDRMAEACSIELNQHKHKGVTGQGIIAGEKVILAKPMTYMNNSGECVGAIARFYKLAPEDIIVIYDDINLDVGQLRIREKGSAGGHNGIKSIIAHLGSENFPRIRIGVGMKKSGQDLANHVLSKFPKDQQEGVAEGMDNAVSAAKLMVTGQVQKAMNQYNGKKEGSRKA
ncbi:MAG: aminoacyl-tRNA hydrolase [Lachnospiraceae bacterium]|nr:aminoacyl-tRNA hydrolase [Lachnospiraceae bacterium]